MRLRDILYIASVLICGTAISSAQFILNPYIVGAGGGGGGYTYVIQQDFEGAGYDNGETWTPVGAGTKDPDYTGIVLEGSQSLRIVSSANTATVHRGISAQAQLTLCLMVRFVGSPPLDFESFLLTDQWEIGMDTGKFQITHGVSQVAGSLTVAADTTYYLWVEAEKSTGSNGKLNLYVSTTTTKPGSPDATRTAGTGTANIENLYLGRPTAATVEAIMDHVRAVAGPVGTVTNWPP